MSPGNQILALTAKRATTNRSTIREGRSVERKNCTSEPFSAENGSDVQFFRSTLLPSLIVLLFVVALFAVSARIWLPGDMLAPAPVG